MTILLILIFALDLGDFVGLMLLGIYGMLGLACLGAWLSTRKPTVETLYRGDDYE